MKLERLLSAGRAEQEKTRIVRETAPGVQDRRHFPLALSVRSIEFAPPIKAEDEGSEAQDSKSTDVFAVPLVEKKSSLSFEEAFKEVNKKLESILADVQQSLFSKISEEGRAVFRRVVSADANGSINSRRAIGLRSLELLKETKLTGTAKDTGEVEAAIKDASKLFQTRFDREIVPLFTPQYIENPKDFLLRLQFYYVKNGNTGSAGRIWKQYSSHLVPPSSTETPSQLKSTSSDQASQLIEDAAPSLSTEHIEERLAPAGSEGKVDQKLIRLNKQQTLEEERGEPWLDQEKEEAFGRLSDAFKGMVEGPEGIAAFQNWFVDFFNATIEDAGRPALTIADIQSVVVLEFSSASANAVAGKELKRPVIVFNDIGELQRFAYRLTGSEAAKASRGFVISPKSFGNHPVLSKTGLIFTFGIGDFASHEVRHTVDPHNHKREDDVVDEAFAYFTQCFPKDEDLNNDAGWLRLAASIHSSAELNQKMSTTGSEKDSQQRITRFIQAIKSYSQGKTLVEVQRFLVQCRTVEEVTMKAGLSTSS